MHLSRKTIRSTRAGERFKSPQHKRGAREKSANSEKGDRADCLFFRESIRGKIRLTGFLAAVLKSSFPERKSVRHWTIRRQPKTLWPPRHTSQIIPELHRQQIG